MSKPPLDLERVHGRDAGGGTCSCCPGVGAGMALLKADGGLRHQRGRGAGRQQQQRRCSAGDDAVVECCAGTRLAASGRACVCGGCAGGPARSAPSRPHYRSGRGLAAVPQQCRLAVPWPKTNKHHCN